MSNTTRCNWCGSSNTIFLGFDCWEDDERGNTIRVNSLNTEFTPRDEIWWCNNCDGASAYPLTEEQDAQVERNWLIRTAQLPPTPQPIEGTVSPRHDTPDTPSVDNPAST